MNQEDRKSTRLNSSHTDIYTLSLHDALPISSTSKLIVGVVQCRRGCRCLDRVYRRRDHYLVDEPGCRQYEPLAFPTSLVSTRHLHSRKRTNQIPCLHTTDPCSSDLPEQH